VKFYTKKKVYTKIFIKSLNTFFFIFFFIIIIFFFVLIYLNLYIYKDKINFNNLKENDNSKEEFNYSDNNGFSNDVLEKVQYDIIKLQENYNFENILAIWNDIFSLEVENKNDNQYLEFSYLK